MCSIKKFLRGKYGWFRGCSLASLAVLAMCRENQATIIDLNPQTAEKSQKFTVPFEAQEPQAEADIARVQTETNKTEPVSTKLVVQLFNLRIAAKQTFSSALSNSQHLCAKYHFSYLSERGLLG